MNFVEELRWRGMLHNIMPGTEELLDKEKVTAYVGFDPTADSLHIGHLCGIMILRHFQRHGHKPLALIGGATGMIGDPSGKSTERNLLDEDTLRHNQESIKKQLAKFLDFDSDLPNKLYLYEHKNCKLQMGGSDQWGNITTGAELIRRTNGGEVFALTCPLITKADGTKFGKTEGGNVWLDPRYTSPYKFYQFWLNVSDEDAARYIKVFTSLGLEEIESLIAKHAEAPHMRLLQKRLAEEVTVMVHSRQDYETAVEASNILFGNATSEALKKLDEDTLLAVFEGVPMFEVSRDELAGGVKAVDLLVEKAAVFPSKGEMRKLVQGGGVSLNKEKLASFDQMITSADLLNGKYLIVQKGKKNYYLVIAK